VIKPNSGRAKDWSKEDRLDKFTFRIRRLHGSRW
jgi:hypothetical protein